MKSFEFIFEFILEFIILICMIILVHAKADIRMVIEAGVLYLALVIRSTKKEDK